MQWMTSTTLNSVSFIGLLLIVNIQQVKADLGRCWTGSVGTQCHGELQLPDLVTKEECCHIGGYFTKISISPREQSNLAILDLLRRHHLLICTEPCEDCSTMECRDGQVCIESEGRWPFCACELECTANQRNSGTICGDDGQTYNNECHLLEQNCLHDKRADISYHGRCKAYSCEGIQCYTRGRYCQTNQFNNPICVPLPRCSRHWNPVCGTDNNTYSNICAMVKSNVLHQSPRDNVLLQYPGTCRVNKSCQSDQRCLRCLSSEEIGGHVCQIFHCQRSCNETRIPVCGTDGQTYINECYLRKISCEANAHTTVQHLGRCEDSEAVIEFDLQNLSAQKNTLLTQTIDTQTSTAPPDSNMLES